MTENFGLGLLGMVFVLIFLGLIILFVVYERTNKSQMLRPIWAFDRLRRHIGLAVEAGKRVHISLGQGTISGLEGGSALIGLSIVERISRTASISDRPPVITSGDSTLMILSQNTTRQVFRSIGEEKQYDPGSGRLTGLTPMAYVVGTMPIIFDEQVATTIIAGHLGSEIALITDAAERTGCTTLAGSDSISAQAVLYATADEPLIGEELFATGAYLNSGPVHNASLRAQDIFRWLLVGALLVGSGLKLVGII